MAAAEGKAEESGEVWIIARVSFNLRSSSGSVGADNLCGIGGPTMRTSTDHPWINRACLLVFTVVAAALWGCAAPLLDASKHGDTHAIANLLDRGAAINARDGNGYTALHWAAYAGHSDSAEILVERGADVDAVDNSKMTPLMVAVCYSHDNVARYLLEKGANVNAHDGGGWTPLDYAASSNDAAITALLIDHGADVNAVENDGKTALQLAHTYKASSVERMLSQHGAKE
jgi:ankyrin repeat protein